MRREGGREGGGREGGRGEGGREGGGREGGGREGEGEVRKEQGMGRGKCETGCVNNALFDAKGNCIHITYCSDSFSLFAFIPSTVHERKGKPIVSLFANTSNPFQRSQ